MTKIDHSLQELTFKSSSYKVLFCVFVLSYIYCWIYVEEFLWFFDIWFDRGLIVGIVICILSLYLLLLLSLSYLMYYILGRRVGLSAKEYVNWKNHRLEEKEKIKKQEKLKRREAIERGERSEFEFFSKSKITSSPTVKEDSSSNHNRFWIIAVVIVCIGGLLSLYFDVTDGTRHSESSYSSPSQSSNSYHISFHNKQLPSTYKIYKKAGTSDTFVIKKDGKVKAEVRGGDSTVEIDNIIYSLPKLQ